MNILDEIAAEHVLAQEMAEYPFCECCGVPVEPSDYELIVTVRLAGFNGDVRHGCWDCIEHCPRWGDVRDPDCRKVKQNASI